jgi:hypothetical protein
MFKSPSVLLTSLLSAVIFTQVMEEAQAKTVPSHSHSGIFVLGGADLPFSPQAEAGDRKVFDLEQKYFESFGIDSSLDAKRKAPRTVTVRKNCRDTGCSDVDTELP